MKTGTKSLLFGVHHWALHPVFVALAWYRLYGFPWRWQLWACFALHDIGYFGSPNMDGERGEEHPQLGARVVEWLCGPEWGEFCYLHSRYIAQRAGKQFTKLCVADKLSNALYPMWLYLTLARWSGELQEYRNKSVADGKYARYGYDMTNDCTWYRGFQKWAVAWAMNNKDAATKEPARNT